MNDEYVDSLNTAAQYPQNLVRPRFYEDSLKAYSERLTRREERLFQDEPRADVVLWQFEDSDPAAVPAFKSDRAKSLPAIQAKLDVSVEAPRCRFFFIHARDSRAKLFVTRPMLTYILSYLQAMPEFLDFLFPFGKQIYREDFQFGGFRHQTRLNDPLPTLPPGLRRSGKDIQACYSLKSIEYSEKQQSCPWVIRQTAMYHTFDFVTGWTSWICVKANALVRKRVKEATSENGVGSFETVANSFMSTLKIHLILVDQAEENWRWYINYLEEQLQKYTGLISTAMANSASTVINWQVQRTQSFPSPPPLRRQFTRRIQTGVQRVWSFPTGRRSLQRQGSQFDTAGLPAPPQYEKPPAPKDPDFQFEDLRGVQLIEERSYEAQLVLKSNVDTLDAMQQYYQTLLKMGNCPAEIQALSADTSRFETRVVEVINSMKIQLSRIQCLLLILANRKTLLLGVIEHRNIEANKRLAEKGQISAERMESMTHQMNEIAKKTAKDTVSMRVITVVTLFFLPGTFISTLMSTDIVRFQPDTSGQTSMRFSPGALKLYLEVCLPMMLATFLAWGVMYQWSMRYAGAHRGNETSDEEPIA